MSNVVDLAQYRVDNSPHRSGQARCLSCKHEWVAVAPMGVNYMECPSCGLMKGMYIHPTKAEKGTDVLACVRCDCDVFFVTKPGVLNCHNCGAVCGEVTPKL